MSVKKRSKVFRKTSLISLMLFLVFAALIAINYSGVTFDYYTDYNESEYKTKYENANMHYGKDITPVKISFVLDSSGSGWVAVNKNNLLGYIRNALHKFEDQSHMVKFDGYSGVEGLRSSGPFAEIESEPNANLWTGIDIFEQSYKTPYGDVGYDYLIEEGILNFNSNNDDNASRILVFFIGSPNPDAYKDDPQQTKDKLALNNIKLYAIGMKDKGVDYKYLHEVTDTVYEDINIEDIESIVTDIIERESYKDVRNESGNSVEIEVPKPKEGNALTSVHIRMYSTQPFEYRIEKITTLKDGRDSVTEVMTGSYEKNTLDENLPDVKIEEESRNLKYRLTFTKNDKDQTIYYDCDYEESKIVLPPQKVIQLPLFEWLSKTYSVPADILSFVGCGAFALLFLIPIIIRAGILGKYKKFASASEVRR